MKKKLKKVVLIIILIITIIGSINMIIEAKNKKDEEQKIDANKTASREDYEIIRVNNKYTLKTNKLGEKILKNIFYDDKNVYLYYADSSTASLFKYNINKEKLVVLYENNIDIYGKVEKIGNNYRLGQKLFSSNFKEISNYPDINGSSLLLSDLKNALFVTESGLILKNTKDGNENLIFENTETEKYQIYSETVEDDHILILKESEEKKHLIILDENYKIANTIEYKTDEHITYKILESGQYILEEKETDKKVFYNVYSVEDMNLVYSSIEENEYTNFIFQNTKVICNDKKGNIVLFDYVSNEKRIIFNKQKEDLRVKKFVMASDNYSLIMTLDEKDTSFYLFYL